MSNIYIQEPPTFGKVLLKTTVGDIDIELWSKETPKACRNFVQLCVEGYYNGTIFHRIVKDFIVQGGDPTGSGEGGESIYGQPFKDEFHTRLRFCRRGLVAMANAGRDDNGSQFFFTMGPTQELQNKHTVFGKVTGDTVFNMLKLQEGVVDHNERPQFPQKILKTNVLNNPFPDIEPRFKDQGVQKEGKRKREKKKGVKDFKLLSFGEEAEEDEEENDRESKRFSGRSKSTHDILDDPKLSAVPAVSKDGSESSDDLSGDERQGHSSDEEKAKGEDLSEEVNRIRNKLQSKKAPPKNPVVLEQTDDAELESYSLGQDKREERQKKTEAIKQEYAQLCRDMKGGERKKEPKSPPPEKKTSEIVEKYMKEKEEYENQKKKLPAKGGDREAFTLALLAKFQKKLETVKDQGEEEPAEEEIAPEDDDADLGKDGGLWMSRKLQFENNATVLAKDANTKEQKAEDWFSIDDPRNPINQRRRQANKPSSSKAKH